MRKKIYLETFKSVLGHSIFHYSQKIQDERMTRTIVITENVNSKLWILPRNTDFGQIFKSQ